MRTLFMGLFKNIQIHPQVFKYLCPAEMYGCFWCSVQGHLIKGECTPVSASGLLSLRTKSRYATSPLSELCMHAPCSLQLSECVCVLGNCSCQRLTLSVRLLILYLVLVQICTEIFYSLHKLNKYWIVCFPLSFCGQSVTPFSPTD